MGVELTVLGCSGSSGAPAGGACSGYIVRAGDVVLWMDCGNGSFTNLQQHIRPDELTAVVITHSHPDHCVDLYGLHVLNKYGIDRRCLPVYATSISQTVLASASTKATRSAKTKRRSREKATSSASASTVPGTA